MSARCTSFCFGTSRDAIKKVLDSKLLRADPLNPGPGKYETDKIWPLGCSARKTTLHARKFYLDDESTAKKRGVPGPGTYED